MANAQYCYFHASGAGGADQIRKVNFNGNTYRKIKFNNTVFTISTWYSGTAVNAVRTQQTYSTKSNKVTDGYAHYFTIKSQSKSGSSWVDYGSLTYTTQFFDQDTDGASMTGMSGYGTYGYLSVSCYAGSATWRDCSSFTPPPATRMYLRSHSVSARYLYSSQVKNDVNFSYSTSSISNSTAFVPENYDRYYTMSNHSLIGVLSHNANYTISGVYKGHHIYPYIQTNTF